MPSVSREQAALQIHACCWAVCMADVRGGEGQLVDGGGEQAPNAAIRAANRAIRAVLLFYKQSAHSST